METISECWYPLISSWPCLSADTWSAWVQAIGSIFAIGVAIAIPAWQHCRDRATARAIDANRYAKVRQLFDGWHSVCSHLRTATESGATGSAHNENILLFENHSRWIEALDLADFPNALALRTHMILLFKIAELQRLLPTLQTIQPHTTDGATAQELICTKLRDAEDAAEAISDLFSSAEKAHLR